MVDEEGKVTIRTIAHSAGVSVPTVSRVLNTPEQVRTETRERVLRVMREYEYFPNERARAMRLRETRNIGVLFPQIRDFFFAPVYSGMCDAAKDEGARILLYDAQLEYGRIMEGFTVLKRQQCDGIVFVSAAVPRELETLIARLQLPVVLALTQPETDGLHAFKVDDVQAGFDAVSHLVSRGHRSIAMISGPLTDPISGIQRHNGYQNAIAHYQLRKATELVAFGEYRYKDGYEAMRCLLRDRETTQFTAVFAASDEMAIGAMRAIHDHGLRVPDDISVIGFDNIVMADMVTPKLTTIAQPFGELGAAAVRQVISLLRNDADSAPMTRYLPHHVVTRESVRMITCDTS